MGGLWDNLIVCRSKRRDCETKGIFMRGILIFVDWVVEVSGFLEKRGLGMAKLYPVW